MKAIKYKKFKSTLTSGKCIVWRYNYKITLSLAQKYAMHFCKVKEEEITETVGVL